MSFIQRNPTLRTYQREGVQKALENLRSGRHTVLVAPTGSGKTVMAAEIAKEFKRVLFVAHRRELVDQARAVTGTMVYADTVQSIRKIKAGSVDLLIIDEAHRAAAKTYRQIINCYPSAVRLGLTATPLRTDGQGLCDAFAEIVEVAKTDALVRAGHLVSFRAFEATDEALERLAQLRERGGDYDVTELAQLMNQPRLIGDVVSEYLKHATGRKAVVFAVSVKHSQALAEAFAARGVRAAHLDGRAKPKARSAMLEALAEGDVDVLCNVELFTEGWDCPPVSCVVMARPTQSLTLYLQCVGRGMRPHRGKRDLVILDHAGNIQRHGYPDQPRLWSIESAAQRSAREAGEAEIARLRALGFGSIEEELQERERFREATYSAEEVAAMLVERGIRFRKRVRSSAPTSVAQWLELRGIKALKQPGLRNRYDKAAVDRVLLERELCYSTEDCRSLFPGIVNISSFLRGRGLEPRPGVTSRVVYDRSSVDAIVGEVAAHLRDSYGLREVAALLACNERSAQWQLRKCGIEPTTKPRNRVEPRYQKPAVDRMIFEIRDSYSKAEAALMLADAGCIAEPSESLALGLLKRHRVSTYFANSYLRFKRGDVDDLMRIVRMTYRACEAQAIVGGPVSNLRFRLKKMGVAPVDGFEGCRTRYWKRDIDRLASSRLSSVA